MNDYPDDCEAGSCWPCHGPVTRPRATIDSRGAPLNSPMVDQRVDNSRNKNSAVPWAVLGASFGFLGFGGMIAVALLKPWESEGRAIRAELQAEFAESVARAEANAELAMRVMFTAKDQQDLDRIKRKVAEEVKQEKQHAGR